MSHHGGLEHLKPQSTRSLPPAWATAVSSMWPAPGHQITRCPVPRFTAHVPALTPIRAEQPRVKEALGQAGVSLRRVSEGDSAP